MIKNKIKITIIMAILAMSILTGCSRKETVIIDDKDKTIIEYNNTVNVPADDNDNIDEYSWEDYNSSNIGIVSDDRFIFTKYGNINNIESLNIKVKVPFSIGATNGTKLDDHTVRFTKDNFEYNNTNDIYNTAYIIKDDKLLKGNNISITACKVYSFDEVIKEIEQGDIFNKQIYIRVNSSDGLIKSIDKIYNNRVYSVYPYSNSIVSSCISKDNYGRTVTKTDGKYKITVTLFSGASKTIDFYIDTEKPDIEIINGKLKCKDKKKNGYASGINNITINGKKVKNGININKLRKNNRALVIRAEDKAGNIRTSIK